jgi:hypothetical protein
MMFRKRFSRNDHTSMHVTGIMDNFLGKVQDVKPSSSTSTVSSVFSQSETIDIAAKMSAMGSRHAPKSALLERLQKELAEEQNNKQHWNETRAKLFAAPLFSAPTASHSHGHPPASQPKTEKETETGMETGMAIGIGIESGGKTLSKRQKEKQREFATPSAAPVRILTTGGLGGNSRRVGAMPLRSGAAALHRTATPRLHQTTLSGEIGGGGVEEEEEEAENDTPPQWDNDDVQVSHISHLSSTPSEEVEMLSPPCNHPMGRDVEDSEDNWERVPHMPVTAHLTAKDRVHPQAELNPSQLCAFWDAMSLADRQAKAAAQIAKASRQRQCFYLQLWQRNVQHQIQVRHAQVQRDYWIRLEGRCFQAWHRHAAACRVEKQAALWALHQQRTRQQSERAIHHYKRRLLFHVWGGLVSGVRRLKYEREKAERLAAREVRRQEAARLAEEAKEAKEAKEAIAKEREQEQEQEQEEEHAVEGEEEEEMVVACEGRQVNPQPLALREEKGRKAALPPPPSLLAMERRAQERAARRAALQQTYHEREMRIEAERKDAEMRAEQAKKAALQAAREERRRLLAAQEASAAKSAEQWRKAKQLHCKSLLRGGWFGMQQLIRRRERKMRMAGRKAESFLLRHCLQAWYEQCRLSGMQSCLEELQRQVSHLKRARHFQLVLLMGKWRSFRQQQGWMRREAQSHARRHLIGRHWRRWISHWAKCQGQQACLSEKADRCWERQSKRRLFWQWRAWREEELQEKIRQDRLNAMKSKVTLWLDEFRRQNEPMREAGLHGKWGEEEEQAEEGESSHSTLVVGSENLENVENVKIERKRGGL